MTTLPFPPTPPDDLADRLSVTVDQDAIDARLTAIEAHLAALVERSNVVPRWLGVKAAAEYASLGEKAIRQLVASRKLTPHRPLRGKILIDRLELDQLIASSTTVPRKSRGRAAGTLAAIHGRMNGEV